MFSGAKYKITIVIPGKEVLIVVRGKLVLFGLQSCPSPLPKPHLFGTLGLTSYRQNRRRKDSSLLSILLDIDTVLQVLFLEFLPAPWSTHLWN